MNKLIMLLAVTLFASPVFAEEAKNAAVEVPAADASKEATPAPAVSEEAPKAAEAVADDASKPAEAVADDAKKAEPAAVEKAVKPVPAKKAKHGSKKHNKSKNYTVLPEKKYKVVPVK